MKQLQSKRLYFKKIQQDDVDFLTKFLSDPELTKYLPLRRPYLTKEIESYLTGRISHWQTHDFGVFILILKSTNRKAGYCGLEYVGDTNYIDIRYGILSEYSGKGMIQEAARGMIEYGFNILKLPVIYGAAIPENRASIEILKKIDMKSNQEVNFYGDIVDYYSIQNS